MDAGISFWYVFVTISRLLEDARAIHVTWFWRIYRVQKFAAAVISALFLLLAHAVSATVSIDTVGKKMYLIGPGGLLEYNGALNDSYEIRGNTVATYQYPMESSSYLVRRKDLPFVNQKTGKYAASATFQISEHPSLGKLMTSLEFTAMAIPPECQGGWPILKFGHPGSHQILLSLKNFPAQYPENFRRYLDLSGVPEPQKGDVLVVVTSPRTKLSLRDRYDVGSCYHRGSTWTSNVAPVVTSNKAIATALWEKFFSKIPWDEAAKEL